jgi:hypothetical protein
MNERELRRLRLASQRIGAARFSDGAHGPTDVVRWMTAMQSQDYPNATWAIGSRLAGASAADVEAALNDGSIVRSWPLRGTLHFVAANDLSWMLALSAPRMVKRAATTLASNGLTPAVLERAASGARTAMQGGRTLRREALYSLMVECGVAADGQARYHAAWYLCQTGVLCLAEHSGKAQTFALLDEWVPQPRRLERDEALGELAVRYFRGRGPATVRDFAWWAALTLSDARRGLDVALPSLERLTHDGVEYFLAPGLSAGRHSGVQLLPGFDEHLLGYQERSLVLPPDRAERVVPGRNGMFLSTLVVDGCVAGTWRRQVNGDSLTVTFEPFEALTAAQLRSARTAAAEYARHRGLTLRKAA